MTSLFYGDIGHEPRLEPPEPETSVPVCPCCGAETDTFYIWMPTGEVSGCGECMRATDAWVLNR